MLHKLEEMGQLDNTIIVFLADHGYQLGEKGKWSKAGSLFEMGTRVPLIVSAPGVYGNGQTCTRIVESLDLYPTLVELCGLPKSSELEGASFTSLLENPTTAWDKPAFSIWSEDGSTVHGTMVRTEQWRYAEFGKDAANGAMLFDVHADPMELTNLAERPEHSDVRSQLSKLIANYSYPA